MSLDKQLNVKGRRERCSACYSPLAWMCPSWSGQLTEQEEQAQGLLGERVVNTPEASSMVFLRAVSLATLWLSLLRRSC